MSETVRRRQNTRMVPAPSQGIIPERDLYASPVLEARHLGIEFGGLKAVEDFNLIIGKTEIAGLIGPNGAGKTTVFNLLTKVYQPTMGSVLLNGRDLHGMNTVQANKLGIARTFQNIRLFRGMSVIDNVKAALAREFPYKTTDSIFHTPRYRKTEKEMDARAQELLEVFELGAHRDVLASNLPYGQQRKLEIARAMATTPKLLLLDEPAAGMNPNETAELMRTIALIRDRFDMTILLIEHDMKLVAGICERLSVLNFGRVLAQGETKAVLSDPEVIKAYLGDAEN